MGTPDFVLTLREKVGTDLLWLSGVTAVVSKGAQVLLVRRVDTGWWTPVTGIIDPGEQPAVAAIREVQEEAAVIAVADRIAWIHTLPAMTYENGDRAQYLDIVIACHWVSGDPHPADSENTDAGWFDLDALPELPGTHRERIFEAVHGSGPSRFSTTGSTATAQPAG